MEETNETELTKFREYLFDELNRIECKCINIITFPEGMIVYPMKKDPAIQLDFIKDGSRYVVQITKHIAGEWYNRLSVKVELTRRFTDSEKIPLRALSVQDTLTVTEQTEEGTVMRLNHRVYDSITCKTPCDANIAAELIEYIFEISKL